jgi:hypothetical protein
VRSDDSIRVHSGGALVQLIFHCNGEFDSVDKDTCTVSGGTRGRHDSGAAGLGARARRPAREGRAGRAVGCLVSRGVVGWYLFLSKDAYLRCFNKRNHYLRKNLNALVQPMCV